MLHDDWLKRVQAGSSHESSSELHSESPSESHSESPSELHGEAKRQIEICNACRYCEGYCAVFPAINRKLLFEVSDTIQLANLCHNCRGCYYACQYTPPHEFAINLPMALARLRHHSWKLCAYPAWLARSFDHMGMVVAAVLVASITALLWFVARFPPPSITSAGGGEGFYAFMSHNAMLAIFIPGFCAPLIAIAISMGRYWRMVGGEGVRGVHILAMVKSVASLRQLRGGGAGCNFEEGDRYSHKRRIYHQLTLYGFLLCFAATSAGTILHYGFDSPAPYPFWSVPKLFGVSGGIILCIGTAGLGWLKCKADPGLSMASLWGGEMAFIVLLFAVSFTGLILYAASVIPVIDAAAWVEVLLPLHLGCVLAFFLLMPYSKMVHGFYRMAALLRDAQG